MLVHQHHRRLIIVLLIKASQLCPVLQMDLSLFISLVCDEILNYVALFDCHFLLKLALSLQLLHLLLQEVFVESLGVLLDVNSRLLFLLVTFDVLLDFELEWVKLLGSVVQHIWR